MFFFSQRSSASARAPQNRKCRAIEPLETRSMLAADVIITEIMYHPQSEDPRDEFIEIYNAEPTAVDLSGWKFSDGVDFTFPLGKTLGPNQYLVIAADTSRFEVNYPSVDNFVGGWSGALSNGGERIVLEDASGDSASSFTYADEGDWALRRDLNNFSGYDGWTWVATHDGAGKSLELVNLTLTNDSGQNWAPSTPNGGTPGAANSVQATNSAPIIRDTIHSPIVPRSTDVVFVTARITDELTTGVSASLMWRQGTTVETGGPSFTASTMFDDGLHGDGAAGDGVYGAAIPAQADRTIIEFYVRAADSANNVRTWPAPSDDAGTQATNALYQVDNSFVTTSDVPDYRMIFTPFELTTFNAMSRSSNAEMNITFVSTIEGVTEVRYQASVRFRGQGSRSETPPNQRINFADDNPWRELRAINLNSRNPHLQYAGMAMFERAGLPAEHPDQVMVRRNGTVLPNAGANQYGFYVQLEPINEDWAANHFPGDDGGNAYRGQNWSLDYRGTDPNSYRDRILKQTNVSEDDFTDVMALGRAFSTAETPNNIFVQRIEETINVQQWLRWLAVNAMMVNEENGLINATSSDEYSLYRGVNDPRFVIAVHDLDNVFGLGDQGGGSPTRDLFEPAGNPALGRLMNHANYRPYYFAHLKQLAETIFSPAQFNVWLDAELGDWVPESIRTSMKNFNAQRVSYVLGQIPPGTPNLSSPADTLRVTEIMYDAPGGNAYDFIELKNTGPSAINLAGVTISGGISYTFGNVNLQPNQYVVVASDEVAFRSRYGAAPNLAGQYSGNLNNSGEQILLQAGSPLFTTILDFTYSELWQPAADGQGNSLVIINPAGPTSSWNSGTSWRASIYEGGSPGADDNEVLAPNAVVINEVLTHTDLAAGDRIELRNLTNQTVNLSNYYLSDDPANRTKYRIPSGTTIAPGGYVAFTQSSHFGPPNTAGTPFGLSELGDDLYLTAANGITTIDSIDFSAAEVEVAFGRHVTSTGEVDYPPMSTPSFGAANPLPKIGPVVINELMYHPLESQAADTEYVELKNVSSSTVQLFDPSRPANTWVFTEGISYTFPGGVTIPAGGFVIVVPFDPAGDPTLAGEFRAIHNVPAEVPLYGPYVGALDNAGEKIELSKPGPPEPDLFVPLIVVDRVTYDDAAPWALEPDGVGSSLSRKIPAAYANDPASWDASIPGGSAGGENSFIDRSPPTVPTDLSINTPQAGQFALQWTASADPDSGIGQYNIYRDGILVGMSTGTSFVDTFVAPRVRFDYQVSAVNGGGSEGPKSSVSVAGYGGIDMVWPLSDTQLVVQFTEQVSNASASQASNYQLSGASVNTATPRADGRSVVLSTTPLVADSAYTLQVSNIAVTFGSAFPPGTSYVYTHEPLSQGMTTRFVNTFAPISSINHADAAVALPAGHANVAAAVSQSIGRVNYVDTFGGNAGHFAGDAAFPVAITTIAPLAMRTTGVLKIETSGVYTFGIAANAGDTGARLRIDGFDLIAHDPLNVSVDRFATATLPAGEHFIDLMYFSNSGSAGVEAFVVPGNFTSFAQSTNWRLLGDTAGSNLSVRSLPPPATDLSWTAGAIPGSFLTESVTSTSTVDGGASVRYRTNLATGQSFSFLATPNSTSATVSLTLRRGSQVIATRTASGPGIAAWLDAIPITTSAIHTIEIATSATTTVNLHALLGGAFEGEAKGQGGNDDLASAQSIDSASIATDAISRVAVTGSIVLPGIYTDLVAQDNPVGRWRLNEPAGGSNTAVNTGSAGIGADGVYFGGATLGAAAIVPNVAGVAASFDGSNDRVEIADNAEINSAGPYNRRTVELWFNAGDVTARRMIFDEGTGQRGLNIYLLNGKLYAGAYNLTSDGASTPWGPISFNTPVVANRTYHVAVTLDATTQTLAAYLDGVAFGQSTQAGPLYSHLTGIRIGRRTETYYYDLQAAAIGSGDAFLGRIAEVALYNSTLSAERIAQHYLAGAARSDDYFAVSLAADEPTSIVVDGAAAGNWSIELQNAAGEVVAMSAPGPANADASIRNYVPTAGGMHYVRIVANVASAYSAFVTRGAEFEREANDSLATAHDISAAGAVLGGLESAAATDAFSVSVTAGQTITIETATPDGVVGANGFAWNPAIDLYAPTAGMVASNDNGAADGRNARLVYTATETGSFVVVVRSADGTRGDYLLTVDSGSSETAQLVDVLVSSSAWSPEFVALLANRGLGDGAISVLSPPPGAANLPWRGLNRVQLVFDRPVAVTSGDLTIGGVIVPQHAIASFESSGNTATWTLTSPPAAERFTLDLSTALETALGGGQRQFRFSVLVGDMNDDDAVTLDDVYANRTLQFRNSTDAAYDPRHDIDGSGVINFIDMVHVRNATGGSLPAGSPSPAAALVVAAAPFRDEARRPAPVAPMRATASRTRLPAAAIDRLLGGDSTNADSDLPRARRRVNEESPTELRASRRLSRAMLDADSLGNVS